MTNHCGMKRHNKMHPKAQYQNTRLIVALVVGDALSVLLVEIEAVLNEELHRLRLNDVFLRTQQRQVVHLNQIRPVHLQAQSRDTLKELHRTAATEQFLKIKRLLYHPVSCNRRVPETEQSESGLHGISLYNDPRSTYRRGEKPKRIRYRLTQGNITMTMFKDKLCKYRNKH